MLSMTTTHSHKSKTTQSRSIWCLCLLQVPKATETSRVPNPSTKPKRAVSYRELILWATLTYKSVRKLHTPTQVSECDVLQNAYHTWHLKLNHKEVQIIQNMAKHQLPQTPKSNMYTVKIQKALSTWHCSGKHNKMLGKCISIHIFDPLSSTFHQGSN